MKSITLRMAVIVALATCFARLAPAEDKAQQPTPQSVTDQQLLEGLQNDLLKGVELEKLPSKNKRDGEPTAEPEDKEAKTADALPGGTEDENPLTAIGRQMLEVSERLARDDSSAATQAAQQEIATNLKKLISDARKRQSTMTTKGNRGETTAQQRITKKVGKQNAATAKAGATVESTERLGKADPKEVDPAEVRQRVEASWGVLPEQVREQMRHSAEDDFLGEFELMIENYFKTLAETEPNRQ